MTPEPEAFSILLLDLESKTSKTWASLLYFTHSLQSECFYCTRILFCLNPTLSCSRGASLNWHCFLNQRSRSNPCWTIRSESQQDTSAALQPLQYCKARIPTKTQICSTNLEPGTRHVLYSPGECGRATWLNLIPGFCFSMISAARPAASILKGSFHVSGFKTHARVQ